MKCTTKTRNFGSTVYLSVCLFLWMDVQPNIFQCFYEVINGIAFNEKIKKKIYIIYAMCIYIVTLKCSLDIKVILNPRNAKAQVPLPTLIFNAAISEQNNILPICPTTIRLFILEFTPKTKIKEWSFSSWPLPSCSAWPSYGHILWTGQLRLWNLWLNKLSICRRPTISRAIFGKPEVEMRIQIKRLSGLG